MVQNEISFPILGGTNVNENGFDQPSDFPDFFPELNERNHVLVDSVSLPNFGAPFL
jgi:hypothetical protein